MQRIRSLSATLAPVGALSPAGGRLLAAALLLAGLSQAALAEAPAYVEGEHYERLPIPVDTRDPEKVEVVEVFSYGCIHCKNFQPYVESWQESTPEYVDFYRLPATFDERWQRLAQLYYTTEALGVTDQVHDAIFRAIHDRGVNLTDPDLMAEMVEAAAGISPDQFMDVYESFSVRSRVQQAHARVVAYRISGTPSLIVDGTFRVDGRMAGGNQEMLDVVDFLVEQQRQDAAAAAE